MFSSARPACVPTDAEQCDVFAGVRLFRQARTEHEQAFHLPRSADERHQRLGGQRGEALPEAAEPELRRIDQHRPAAARELH